MTELLNNTGYTDSTVSVTELLNNTSYTHSTVSVTELLNNTSYTHSIVSVTELLSNTPSTVLKYYTETGPSKQRLIGSPEREYLIGSDVLNRHLCGDWLKVGGSDVGIGSAVCR